METYNPSDVIPPSGWYPYTNELLQIKLDGSEIRRLAHHHSRPLNGYNYQPKLTASRDGTRLVYASNFSLQSILGYSQDYSDVYMIENAPPNSVANGASFRANSGTAPGSIVSIFGTGLADGTQSAVGVPIATTLLGIQVSFNNVPAPLFYVSPTQINAQVPFGLPPGSVTVEVRTPSSSGVRQTITVAAAAPGIFTTNQQGTGPGAILHADDFRTVSERAPARPGEYISIFCTGLGELKSLVAAGNAATYPPPETVLTPEVRVGGILANVSFSGLAPGFVGLYQVNVQVPLTAPTGNAVPLVLTSGGAPSNTVTVAIQ
ncbi:MAG: hypothetical protein A3I78_11150 [Gammaproteobacteria bacterium RIFCSPLOWO2_02_FULL_56_15]|nr:MAG: hypothetical protein A3I78_11150 [Gammaproteobacteria bacterium RIFCSPLOWO2_02_FULL_56_15]